jgi:hypothetical protein
LLNGTVYRLWRIDAPERNQYCSDGWPVGSLAKARLQSLIDGKAVHCDERERDICGHAQDYIGQEARAKEEGLGIHTHPCNPPWIWRSERRQQARQQIAAAPRQCERRRWNPPERLLRGQYYSWRTSLPWTLGPKASAPVPAVASRACPK